MCRSRLYRLPSRKVNLNDELEVGSKYGHLIFDPNFKLNVVFNLMFYGLFGGHVNFG